MSLLKDIQYFQAWDEDEHDGLGFIDAGAENAVQQYSRQRYEQSNRAREQLEEQNTATAEGTTHAAESWKNRREERDGQIEATISTDLADGLDAIIAASFADFWSEDLSLVIPTDELEDHEIHLIGQNYLRHEIEFRFLEHQQQLPRIRRRRYKRYSRIFDHKNYKRNEMTRIKKVNTTSPRRSRRSNIDKRRRTGEGSQPEQKRRERLRDTKSNEALASQTDQATETPYCDIIYEVSCSDPDRHHISVYRDMPTAPTVELDMHESPYMEYGLLDTHDTYRRHMQGKVPVLDLQDFMQDQSDDVAFVIMRTVHCTASSILIQEAGGAPQYDEKVYARSSRLQGAIHQSATCYWRSLPKIKDPVNLDYSYKSEAPPPSYDRNRIGNIDAFFFHHALRFLEHPPDDPEIAAQIQSLLQYVDVWYGQRHSQSRVSFTNGQVTQENIGRLFLPNELVLSASHGEMAAFVLQRWPIIADDGWVTLHCWSFQCEGTSFVRKKAVLSIPPIRDQSMDIKKLAAYPLRFADRAVMQDLELRGRKLWSLRNATHVTYKGVNVKGDQYYPDDSRFVIDYITYRKMHQHSRAFDFSQPTEHLDYDKLPIELALDEEPSETCLMLMPPDVYGFYLHEKKWIHLFVKNVETVQWNKKAYERLVLPESTKELVRALVTVRTSHRGVKQGLGFGGKRTDITSGKGNGLIMLLHGGPGTGKTLTAESVAEIAEMPLYRVTCGDIGTSADQVEKYLHAVLHLGKIWNCVLLLDEADVFLEERSNSDLTRNSLVSVFLRILEYYDGILVLTSNRVGIFDEAFKSRIQVALHYENLTRTSRKKIWENFFDMLEEDEEDVNLHELRYRLDELSSRELNGRQIRNILTTARQLAIHKNERLDWIHLKHALSVATDFSDYLRKMQGHTDDQHARDFGLRA